MVIVFIVSKDSLIRNFRLDALRNIIVAVFISVTWRHIRAVLEDTPREILVNDGKVNIYRFFSFSLDFEIVSGVL